MPASVHRFHVPRALVPGSTVCLPPDRSRQAARVLRLRTGDAVVLFNGDGQEVPGRVADVTAHSVSVTLGQPRPGRGEPRLEITLAQALLKSDRFDWVVQKTTELGVARIVPLLTERTVVSLRDGQAADRVSRWGRIAVEAAEQSGRVTVPSIAEPRPLIQLVDEIARQPAIVFWEGESLRTVAEALPVAGGPLLLVVGPEGGLSDEEAGRLAAAGARTASLGTLILRAETAAVAGVAAVLAVSSARPSEEAPAARPGEATSA